MEARHVCGQVAQSHCVKMEFSFTSQRWVQYQYMYVVRDRRLSCAGLCVVRYQDACPNWFWRIIRRMLPSWREWWSSNVVCRMPMTSALPDDSECINCDVIVHSLSQSVLPIMLFVSSWVSTVLKLTYICGLNQWAMAVLYQDGQLNVICCHTVSQCSCFKTGCVWLMNHHHSRISWQHTYSVVLLYCEDVNWVYIVCGSQLLEARQNFTATSLGLLRNYRKRQQLTALLKSLRTIKTLVSWFHCLLIWRWQCTVWWSCCRRCCCRRRRYCCRYSVVHAKMKLTLSQRNAAGALY